MLNIPRPMAASRTARPDGVAAHSFPMNGLVAQGRMAYESNPLLTARIRSGVFVLAGAGGDVTAISGPRG